MGFSDCADIFHDASASDLPAHNLKVVGSIPTPATNKINDLAEVLGYFLKMGCRLRCGDALIISSIYWSR